jgi:hypothetical protein
MEQQNDTYDTSVPGTGYCRIGIGGCTGARARTERSSVRGIGITAGRLGL